MFADDLGIALMRLYRELRSCAEPQRREALKARIDQLVAEAAQQTTTLPPLDPERHDEKDA
jgi:hypothetical protein